MQDNDKPGRAQDPVEQASGESFPASDPPAWTSTRAGKPESPSGLQARRAEDPAIPRDCEVIGLFRSHSEAEVAADALLKAGFNVVDIGPPRWHGNLGAGIGDANRPSSLGMGAALGALAAATVAALFMPRGRRHVLTAATAGAIGAASAHAAARMTQKRATEPGWPENGVLVRAGFKTADEQNRAFSILEAQGACKLHVSRPQSF